MTMLLVATGQADPSGQSRGSPSGPSGRPGHQPYPWAVRSRLPAAQGDPSSGPWGPSTRTASVLTLASSAPKDQARFTVSVGGSAAKHTVYAHAFAPQWRTY